MCTDKVEPMLYELYLMANFWNKNGNHQAKLISQLLNILPYSFEKVLFQWTTILCETDRFLREDRKLLQNVLPIGIQTEHRPDFSKKNYSLEGFLHQHDFNIAVYNIKPILHEVFVSYLVFWK